MPKNGPDRCRHHLKRARPSLFLLQPATGCHKRQLRSFCQNPPGLKPEPVCCGIPNPNAVLGVHELPVTAVSLG